MNLDEQFLEMTDKTRLIEQVNENVIRFQSRTLQKQKLYKLKTLREKFLGVFSFSNKQLHHLHFYPEEKLDKNIL